MDELSTILPPNALSSESSQPEGPQKIEQDDISLYAASTLAPDLLKSQTATLAEACQLAETRLRSQFINNFLQLIYHTEFEFGFSTPADRYVRDALNNYGPFARDWISFLFIQSFGSPFVLSAILRVIAHFDYQQMGSQVIIMAIAATRHTDADVRECGVRCFESWEAPESLEILRNLSFPEDWLSEYLADVISELEEMDKHGIRR